MAEHLTVNVDEFTLGELEEIEESTGYSVLNPAPSGLPIKAVIYMIYVQKRRANTAFTLDDARAFNLQDLQPEPAPDPTLRSPTPLSGRSPDTAAEPEASSA